jgi:hypothetical protein
MDDLSKIYTPELILAMKNVEKERVKSMLIELSAQTSSLTKKDIGTWRQAWQMAIHPETPKRAPLYDVYTDVDIDLHLTGAIGQRKGMVLKKSFKIVDKNGKEKPELTELFETEWFKNYCEYVLDVRYWGHSLIQFGDIVTPFNGVRKFDKVELVPRKHVIPEFGVIIKNISDEPKKGISFRDGKIADWVIEAGKSKDLGLLLKCAPPALSKKNMLAFWDAFGEMFGMPIRIGKTTSRDQTEITKVEKMLADMGAAAWGLFPEGTEIEIKETTRGDAFEVYDRRIIRANSEISKGILNQTMTIDDGSSRSQSETHLEVFQNVVDADADMLRDHVNNTLIPKMIVHGFPLDQARFSWDENIDYTPEQQRSIEEMLLNNGYEIEPKYFVDKYNIPITGKKAPEKPTTLSFFG